MPMFEAEGVLSSPALDEWQNSRPIFSGYFGGDLAALEIFINRGEDFVAPVNNKPNRSASEQTIVDKILKFQRIVRISFLRYHIDHIYEHVTQMLIQRHSLDKLVAAISKEFPSLLPSSLKLERENLLCQADKEGLDIDYGIVLREILRSALSGRHLMDSMRLPSEMAGSVFSTYCALGRLELETITLERVGKAGYITLHNTGCLNAEDQRFLRDLETAVDLVLMDQNIAVGILRGGIMDHPKYRGRRVFCAGLNLRALVDGHITLVDFLLARELGLMAKLRFGLFHSDESELDFERMHKPWIAAVDSFAIGGGLQLVFAADHVIAVNDAYFVLPAVSEGIIPGSANLRILHQTGSRLGRQMILFGQRVNASDPEAKLLCDKIVPEDEMESAIEYAAEQLDTMAAGLNRTMLVLAEEGYDQLRTYLAEFAVFQAKLINSREVGDRVARFFSQQNRS